MEEDLSDDFDVISDDDLAIPGVPTPGQEDDLVAATESLVEKLKQKWTEFNQSQEEMNSEYFQGIQDRQAVASEIMSATATQAVDVIGQLGERSIQRNREHLQQQLDQGLISQQEFEARSKQIDRKEARRKKSLELFESVIATLRAINQASPNLPLMAFAGVSGAANTALIASKQPPAFAKGVVQLQGDGTETSDSIPALLSRNESVITAAGTRQDVGLFKAANRLKLKEYITEAYVLPEVKKAANLKEDEARQLLSVGKGLGSDVRMIDGIGKMRSQSKLNTRQIVQAIHSANKSAKRRSFN